MTLVVQKGEEDWLVYKVRKNARTRLRIAPLKRPEQSRYLGFWYVTRLQGSRIYRVSISKFDP